MTFWPSLFATTSFNVLYIEVYLNEYDSIEANRGDLAYVTLSTIYEEGHTRTLIGTRAGRSPGITEHSPGAAGRHLLPAGYRPDSRHRRRNFRGACSRVMAGE